MKKQSPLRNRVKELRARLGIRQADLAREVGITRQTIIAIEKGRLNPSILICLKVARLLREPVDYIFYLAAGWDSADGVVAEPPPQASTRVRVPSKKRKVPSIQGTDMTYEAEPAPATPGRYDLDRDRGADTVDETAEEPVPESVTAEAKPEPKQEEKPERKPKTEEPDTEKQGQAIWDFF